MFFPVSKIFWAILSPLNAVAILFAFGLVLRVWNRKAGRNVVFVAAALFLALGLLPVGHNAIVWLEGLYQRPDPMPEKIAGIIALGGAFDTVLSERTGDIEAGEGIDRIHALIALSRQYPDARLAFVGGSGAFPKTDRKEADDVKSFLERIGFPADRVVYERESRNTHENAAFAMKMLAPKQGEKWVVITSAFHMPRTVAIFRELGWGIIPYPVDRRTDGRYRILPGFPDLLRSYDLLNIAMKEVVGTFVYYVTGKSALPFPQRSDIVFGQMTLESF